MDIRICIAELLSLHDCVIIPGFGGFIGNYSPARIDPVNHTFQPPTKKLLFNINLKQNDGLLANAVAATFITSYSEACRIIEDFSEECRFILKTEKPIILPQVGKLLPGKEGIIHFEQDLTANLLADAFGLIPFISPPVIRSASSFGQTWKNSNRAIQQTGRKFVFPRVLKWAAVIALPIGVAAVIGVTQYDNLSARFSNSAGIVSSVFTRFSAPSPVVKKVAPAVVSLPKVLPEVKPVAEAPTPVNEPPARNDDRYAVIVGAFRLQENAEKLIAELQEKGINASIFDQSRTGLFRVTIGTSADQANAKQLLALAKSNDISGAWILAK
jgi:hypothetical protein